MGNASSFSEKAFAYRTNPHGKTFSDMDSRWNREREMSISTDCSILFAACVPSFSAYQPVFQPKQATIHINGNTLHGLRRESTFLQQLPHVVLARIHVAVEVAIDLTLRPIRKRVVNITIGIDEQNAGVVGTI